MIVMRRFRFLSAKLAVVLAVLAGVSSIAVPVAEATGTAPTFSSNPYSLTLQVGQSFSGFVDASGSPTPTISEAGTVPSWLTVNTSFGGGATQISGTPPTNSGGNDVVSFSLSASNGVNPGAITEVEISVDQPPTITSSTSLTAAAGTALSQQIVTSGYPAPTFTATGLPSDISLSSTGALAITPQTPGGNYSFSVTATNGISPATTEPFTFYISQAPTSLTIPYPMTMVTGVDASYRVTAAGYPSPAMTETGPLPSGLSFVDNGDGTGTLSGTPSSSATGSSVLSFTATNATGSQTGSASFTVEAVPQITVPSTDTLATDVGTSTKIPLSTSGYPVPTLSLVAGTIPSGMSLSGTTISGTPFTAGTYPITLRASNVAGVATQSLTITVNGELTLPVITLPAASEGQPYSYQIPTVGGTAPFTFTVLSNNLPEGLSLSNSGVLSGTATMGDVGRNEDVYVSVTDSAQQDQTADYLININALGQPVQTKPSITTTHHPSTPTSADTSSSSKKVSLDVVGPTSIKKSGSIIETLRIKNDSTGTVKVTSGRKFVCTVKVKASKAVCRIRAKTLGKGSHTVTFSYTGPQKVSAHVRKKITVR